MSRSTSARSLFFAAGSLALLLATVLIGCGGEPAIGPETSPDAQTTSTGEASGTHQVSIDGHSLTLPDGLTVTRWVSGHDALRMMAETSDGMLLVTEMAKGNVLAFPLADDNPQPATVVSGLSTPSGIAFSNGVLYVAETEQVSTYPYLGSGRVGPQSLIIPDLPSGGHSTRTIGIGPDNKIYVAIGSSCNICEETDPRRAAMSRYNIDGSGGEVIAGGLRNTVGFTWHPVTGEIWGTDNGRDNIGDDLPPDEVNIIIPGKNYGWPYCYGTFQVDPRYVDDTQRARFCESTWPPEVELQAHSAPLGPRFLSDPDWPAAWQDNLFIAFHGSWNRTVPTGYKVVRVDGDGQVSDFITGWRDEHTGEVWGRPVDILFANNKMYISDDYSGSIYVVQRQPTGAGP